LIRLFNFLKALKKREVSGTGLIQPGDKTMIQF